VIQKFAQKTTFWRLWRGMISDGIFRFNDACFLALDPSSAGEILLSLEKVGLDAQRGFEVLTASASRRSAPAAPRCCARDGNRADAQRFLVWRMASGTRRSGRTQCQCCGPAEFGLRLTLLQEASLPRSARRR